MTDTVTENIAYLPTADDTYGDEVVMIVNDERLPGAPYSPNALHIYDPVTKERFPVYSSEWFYLWNVWFVEDGNRILLQAGYPSFDFWLLLGRDGHLVRPLRDLNRDDIHSTRRGFLYIDRNIAGNDTTLMDYDTDRPFSDHEVWHETGLWHIGWMRPTTPSAGVFTNWRQLAPAITAPPLPVREVRTLPIPPRLLDGKLAQVQTVDGEVLYLRDAPGGEIVRYLYDGMQVQVIDGPVELNGYTWWQVQVLEDDSIGWAVQAVEDLTTLILYRPEDPSE